MVKKIKKMKHGAEALACIIPVLYIIVLTAVDVIFDVSIMSYRSQLLKLFAGCATAFFAYEFHAAARELPAKKNILISSVYLFAFTVLWIVYLLFPLIIAEAPFMHVFGFLYTAFAWHPSIIGAWLFMFVMEIVRNW